MGLGKFLIATDVLTQQGLRDDAMARERAVSQMQDNVEDVRRLAENVERLNRQIGQLNDAVARLTQAINTMPSGRHF